MAKHLPTLGLFAMALLLEWSPPKAEAASPVFADSRDQATLLPQYLVNRNLISQLSDPEQWFRLGDIGDHVALAGDLAIGTQQTYFGGSQTRFHGFYLARTYAGVKALPGLEANLNVLYFTPSASEPYRAGSQFNAGLALHGYMDVLQLAGHPLRLDILGTDLDWVTLGRGLMLERTPVEGVMAAASWRDLSLLWMYAGRALWDDDNLIATTLSAFGGRVQLMQIDWETHNIDKHARYSNLAAGLPLTSWFSVGAEGSLRDDKGIHHLRGGALLRADAIERGRRFQLHLGYQFRWYQDGFGPRDDLQAPRSTFNVPYREDVYVTSSYEYLGISKVYEQWSHTLMFEGRVLLASRVQLFADTEAWLRYAAARAAPWVLYTPDGFRAPGRRLTGYYRAGLRVFPWPGLPHRLSAYLTNKQVNSLYNSSLEVERRFEGGTYVLFTMEAFL